MTQQIISYWHTLLFSLFFNNNYCREYGHAVLSSGVTGDSTAKGVTVSDALTLLISYMPVVGSHPN